MSAEITTLKDLPKEIVSEVKSQAQPASKSGISAQIVGFVAGMPLSMLYDWLYNLVASKAITNEIARDIIKVVLPLSVGIGVQVAKVPFGNLIAGTGYGIAIISLGRILYRRFKGVFGVKTTDDSTMSSKEAEEFVWGVQ